MPLAIFLLLFLSRSLSLLPLSSAFLLSSPRSSQGSAGCPSEQRGMRGATRLSASWDRSPCAPSPWPCRRCPPRGRLRRPAPRRRRRPRACAPPSSRRRPRARSRGRRPRAASRRAWPRPRRCVLSTPTAVPYMAAVIDLCTRMAPVLAFPGRTAADLPIAALGAISRSDRGSQHAPEAGDGRLGARRTT